MSYRFKLKMISYNGLYLYRNNLKIRNLFLTKFLTLKRASKKNTPRRTRITFCRFIKAGAI